MADVGGTGTAEAAVCRVSPPRRILSPHDFETSFAGVYDAAACGDVNSSQSLRKQPFKSPWRGSARSRRMLCWYPFEAIAISRNNVIEASRT